MWALGSKASKTSRLPSECVPGLDEIACDWTIWQFDNAVLWFVATIESALIERETVAAPRNDRGQTQAASSYAKYTLDQLLDDGYRLPRPLSYREQRKGVGSQLKAMFGVGGTKKGKGKGKGKKPMLPPSLAKQWLARGRTL